MRAFETQCSRVLVVAAHPDDETIGCGALLGRVSDAHIAHLTDGVPEDASLRPIAFRNDVDAYRLARDGEMRRALALVGVDEDRVIRLGGVDQESSYTMLALVDRLLGVIEEIGPSLVITHPYEGGHPDHDTAAFVTRMASTLRQIHGGSSPPIWEMTSYHARGGQLVTGTFLDDPCANETRTSFTLTLSTDERRRKERMMRCFATQEAVLAAFGVDTEVFRHAPLYDFFSPPHRGPLHYEQLGWPLSGRRWRELAKEAAGRLLGPS
jgi:LmbE family N-acetylglucosaminyl deacetylase